MELPQAPRWFVKGLKAIDPTLGVRFVPSQGWQIVQMRKRVIDYGRHDEVKISRVEERPNHVMWIPSIGSRAFDEIKRAYMPRYRYEEYCKEFGMAAS